MKQSVQQVDITHGAKLQIDLSFYSEPEPVFAYVDDTGDGVEPLFGLELEGRMMIRDQADFMWLDGDRDCLLLKVNAEGKKEGRAVLRSLGIGEFCLEIYYIKPDQAIELIYQDDYCFK